MFNSDHEILYKFDYFWDKSVIYNLFYDNFVHFNRN